jgi:hypothetical protein
MQTKAEEAYSKHADEKSITKDLESEMLIHEKKEKQAAIELIKKLKL